MTISAGLVADTTLRASGQVCRVHWINISNNSTAGTAGHIIIEDGAGGDLLRIPFASSDDQNVFISFPEPLRSESGLIINFVTVTNAIVDVGWEG